MKLLVQALYNWKDPYNVKRRTEIPSLDQNDLKKAQQYCEENHITGTLYDIDVLCGNEWFYVNGILTDKENYEKIVYGYYGN